MEHDSLLYSLAILLGVVEDYHAHRASLAYLYSFYAISVLQYRGSWHEQITWSLETGRLVLGTACGMLVLIS